MTTTVTPESLVGQEKINSFCAHFDRLAGRWADEQEYEDFATYRKSAETAFGFPVKSMTRKPFQVIFNVNGVEVFFRATRTRITCGTVVYK